MRATDCQRATEAHGGLSKADVVAASTVDEIASRSQDWPGVVAKGLVIATRQRPCTAIVERPAARSAGCRSHFRPEALGNVTRPWQHDSTLEYLKQNTSKVQIGLRERCSR